MVIVLPLTTHVCPQFKLWRVTVAARDRLRQVGQALASFFVISYDKPVSAKANLRGRPRTGTAMTAAERMQRLRERRRAAGFKAVLTWVPTAGRPISPASSHRLIEARSLAMHALIVRKIERDPKLLGIAQRNIARWAERYADSAPAWLKEWREILSRPWPEIASLLTEQSENAARLRQSTPFAGVLKPAERRRVHEALRA